MCLIKSKGEDKLSMSLSQNITYLKNIEAQKQKKNKFMSQKISKRNIKIIKLPNHLILKSKSNQESTL